MNDDLLFEGPRGNTTTSIAGWNFHEASVWVRYTAAITTGNIYPISRDTRVASIEERGCGGVISPQRPVVIWKITLVSALITQSLLLCPHKVAVPRQEVALVDVSYSDEAS